MSWGSTEGSRLRRVAACTALVVLMAAPAQAAGTKDVDRSATLATSDQPMWGDGAPSDRNFDLFGLGWNEGDSGGSIENLEFDPTPFDFPEVCVPGLGCVGGGDVPPGPTNFGSFGAGGSGHTKGDIGMSVALRGMADGKLGVDYPVDARYTVPADKSFGPGETVTISTAKTPGAAAKLQTQFPNLQRIALNGRFGFQADASFNMCFVSCSGNTSIADLSMPSGYNGSNPASGEIVGLTEAGPTCSGVLASSAFGFGQAPSEYDRCRNPTTGVNGAYLNMPNVKTTSTLNPDGSLSASGTDPYAVLPVSAINWGSRFMSNPPKINFGPTSYGGVTVGWSTVDLNFNAIEKMQQDLRFTPRVDTTLSWGQPLAYEVLGEDGSTVAASGTAAQATFPLGRKIRLTLPETLDGQLDLAAALSMGGARISNRTVNSTIGNGRVSALSARFDTPSYEAFDLTIWPGTGFNFGPVLNHVFPLSTRDDVLADDTWQLAGFNSPSVDPVGLRADRRPVPAAKTVGPVEGASFTGTVASFHDPDEGDGADDYTATIDWGDGEPTSDGTLVDDPDGSFHVAGTHTYERWGTYPVTVRVQDLDLASVHGTADSEAIVADAPVHVDPVTDRVTTSGQPVKLWATPPAAGVIASFTDENPKGVAAHFTATIIWGDGSRTPGTIATNSRGGWDVSGAHTFAALGLHPVTVRIDGDGGATDSDVTTLLAYGYTATGNFVIGRPAVPAGPVYWWGAQWVRNNVTAGGPGGFHGFANGSAAQPACGQAWTSRQPVKPPVAVPAYMAVTMAGTAAESVTRSGPEIHGDAPKVVVVRTDPGYGAVPGKPGTGTVIATVCG